jgi:colanic acid biosynthesis glycosyl transferase WcaI
MKILIVGLNFQPELTGIGRYTGELAAYLAARGHTVHVITTPPYYPHWKIQDGYHSWRYQKETWQEVEVHRCPLWVPLCPRGLTRLIHLASFAFSSLPPLMARLRWKPDLVFTVAPSFMNAPFALAFARLSGAIAWLHMQDFELDAAANLDMLPGRRYIYPLAHAFEQFILIHFDHVSTISENMRLLSIKKGVEPERAFLLPNWVDTNKISPLQEPSSLRAELNISPETFVALYHGNMGCKQGLEILLDIAGFVQDNSEILFVICGEGPAKKGFVDCASSHPNVRFLDLQCEERLNDLVNLADVHLLPQRANAADLVMPSKLITMLASGRPVIAEADQGTQISKVLNKVGILVQPGNSAAFAKALVELFRDPSERLRLGNLSRTYACQHFDKETILSHFNLSITLDDWTWQTVPV